MNRLRSYRVSLMLLQEILRTGHVFEQTRVVEGLPPDATICRIVPDSMLDIYSVIVSSKEFDEVPEGGLIPPADLLFERI